MIKIEVQFFNGCPNSDKMIEHVKEAVLKINENVDYKEILVDTAEKAKNYKFRGSPTVLINGHDLEDMPASETGNLSCRFYKEGIPSAKTIEKLILKISKPEK